MYLVFMSFYLNYIIYRTLLGVIPRAVREIFGTIKRLQEEANSDGRPAPTFEIHVQFLEVYIGYN